jgi:hypothetical protein
MILSGSLPLALAKRPKRWVVLASGGLLSGLAMGIVVGIYLPIYVGDFSTSLQWRANLSGLFIGSVSGAGVAWSLWRRHITGAMPSPWVGCALGVVLGLGTGLTTAIVLFPTPVDRFIVWVLSVTVGATAILWGNSLAIRIADRLVATQAMANEEALQ